MRPDPVRHRDGRFAPDPRPEAPAVDLAADSTAAGPAPRPDWPEGYWIEHPPTAPYQDLPRLVSHGEDPFAHATGDAWVKTAEARLERSFDLATVSHPASPEDLVDALDWDEEDVEERDADVDTYTDLAEVLAESPWEAPPILVVTHRDGSSQILDGNHRAALALREDVPTHPAYVLTEPADADCATCRFREEFRTRFPTHR